MLITLVCFMMALNAAEYLPQPILSEILVQATHQSNHATKYENRRTLISLLRVNKRWNACAKKIYQDYLLHEETLVKEKSAAYNEICRSKKNIYFIDETSQQLAYAIHHELLFFLYDFFKKYPDTLTIVWPRTETRSIVLFHTTITTYSSPKYAPLKWSIHVNAANSTHLLQDLIGNKQTRSKQSIEALSTLQDFDQTVALSDDMITQTINRKIRREKSRIFRSTINNI